MTRYLIAPKPRRFISVNAVVESSKHESKIVLDSNWWEINDTDYSASTIKKTNMNRAVSMPMICTA